MRRPVKRGHLTNLVWLVVIVVVVWVLIEYGRDAPPWEHGRPPELGDCTHDTCP